MTAIIVRQAQLRSVKLVNRILYLNSDPTLNYLLPVSNGWTVDELASEIWRACAQYGIITDWNDSKFLALQLHKDVVKETVQLKGGFDLGWL